MNGTGDYLADVQTTVASDRIHCCTNHPATAAAWRCLGCGREFCQTCVKEMTINTSTTQVCYQCGEMCVPFQQSASGESSATRSRSFWNWLSSVPAYPLRGDGVYILLLGMIVFSIVEFIATMMLFAVLVGSVIAGFLCKYYVRVIHLSARGIDVPPSWGEIDSSDVVDFIRQALRTAGVAVFYGVLPFLYCWFVSHGALDPVFWSLVGLGVLCYPMALLAVLYYEDILEVNPCTVVRSILRVPWRYGAVLLFVAAAVVLSALLHFGIQTLVQYHDVLPLKIVGVLTHRLVSLYFYTAIMHLLGVLILTSKSRLGWD